MRTVATLAGFLALIGLSYGREVEVNGTPRDQRFGFSAGYYGVASVWSEQTPGIQIGVERYLAATPHFRIIGALNLHSGYRPDHHLLLTLSPKLGYRFTSATGIMAEHLLGVGCMATRYLYDTYRLEHGDIINYRRRWMTSATVNVTLGAGYDFSKLTPAPLVAYIRAEGSLRYPVAHPMFSFMGSVAAGIIYPLRGNSKLHSPNSN